MIETLFTNPLVFLIGAVAIVASLSFHEFSHAVAGTIQGDDTARRMGRLTLNPMSHIDWLGLLALMTVGFGWGKPVPFNGYNLRNQKWGPSIVAAAGPLSNVLLVVLAASALKLVTVATSLPGDNALIYFLAFMIQINCALFFFNLIPVPPLDGSKFLLSALDGPQHYQTRHTLETRGPIILLMLILADSILLGNLIFGTIFGAIFSAVVSIFGLGGVL